MTLRFSFTAVLLLVLLNQANGQAVPPPPPAFGKAPLLFVRFAGLNGLQATFYQGSPLGRKHEAPVAVGLRPGYLYRVKLTGWPGRPGLALYPTLEVRGSLHLPPRQNPADHPAPVVIHEADLERVLAGSLVTKVIYLEDPEQATPAAAPADQPIETDVPRGDDPVQEARQRGRLMLIVRLGLREVDDDEMARQNVPGTMLLPGETVLGAARQAPLLPWQGVPVYDPLLGPRPATEECLHDGGDSGRKAGFDRDGRLRGVDPADAVAEYADSQGRRRVAVSNRVCLCVPRFAVLRAECPVAGHDTYLGPGGAHTVLGQVEIGTRQPSLQAQQVKQPGAFQGRVRPSEAGAVDRLAGIVRVEMLEAFDMRLGPAALLGTQAAQRLEEMQRTRLLRQLELARELSQQAGTREVAQVERTSVVGRVEGLDVISSAVETRDLTVCCNEPPRTPDKPLVLFKWCDAQAAKLGEVVTFYLKFSNHGGQPIADVAVVDSLTGRLEYVPGSAKSDRAAVFTTQENEAGSATLRWEISGRLLPGQSGVVSFQARIR